MKGEKPLVVYIIQRSKDGKKSFWHRCGVGFRNRDGSVTLSLDLFPDVSLQLRETSEDDQK
jgi:hypothetical protein